VFSVYPEMVQANIVPRFYSHFQCLQAGEDVNFNTPQPVVSSDLMFDHGQNGASATDDTKNCDNALVSRGSTSTSTHETPNIPPRSAGGGGGGGATDVCGA